MIVDSTETRSEDTLMFKGSFEIYYLLIRLHSINVKSKVETFIW